MYPKVIVWLLCLLVAGQLAAQSSDTTIYSVVEEMPRFPACEKLDTTLEVKVKCANQQLLLFVNQNVRYPRAAVEAETEGTVVISFVIEKDGGLSNLKIVKDIGNGCGEEALRVIRLLPENDVKWVPGKKDGQAVRVVFNLPVRFRLEEAPAFSMVAGDSVWTVFDKPLTFEGGEDAFNAFVESKVAYPASGNDSCRIGAIGLKVLVRPNGDLRVLDLTDYNDLGFDFWYAAVNTATSTYGRWTPAEHKGRQVPTAFDLNLAFNPTAEGCKARLSQYEQASALMDEGSVLFATEGQQAAGIAKMDQALTMFPLDGSFLLVRGQAHLEMNNFPGACADLTQAKYIALISWYDDMLPLLCSGK